MIAFRDPLPQVPWGGDRVLPLTVDWIAESLHEAAERAQVQDRSWSVPVAQAIITHLVEHWDSRLILPRDLEFIMRSSLAGIGQTLVCQHCRLLPPRVIIFLPYLASHAAHEMLFFNELGRRLEEALRMEIRGVRLEGLRECVKILDSASRWRRTCHDLSEEIVNYSKKVLARGTPEVLELELL